ncbi:MAG TPA: glycosyltransferase family 2 protein [Acidimicrobiales bacterium]|nr:glycosyltransferase family 2 protein [Acidimicrobiales bacterium]
MTEVRIGIVSWNSAEVLGPCLASLPAAADGLEWRAVVYDNASADRSVAVASSHPGVEVVEGRDNIGYSRAINRIFAPADRPDILIALNPDTVCPPGSLTRLCRALMGDPQLGLVVPTLVFPDGTRQPSVYRFPSVPVAAAASFLPLFLQRGRLGRRFGLEAASPADGPVDIDWAVGAVHVIRAAALAGRPAYNERWFMYSEDLDLCWTLGAGGWRRRLHPEVAVTHIGNASGRLAWPEGRTDHWLPATYDWYRFRRGEAAARRWSAVNVLGAGWRLALKKARGAAGRRVEPWEEELAPALRLHWRFLRTGALAPPAPPTGPTGRR